MVDMATVLTNPIQPEDELRRGAAASRAFVPTTHGMEVGHVAMPIVWLEVPGEYDVWSDVVRSSSEYSAQDLVTPIAGFWDQAQRHRSALASIKRSVAESSANALEARHAHRSTMRAIRRDPVLAQFRSLGDSATNVALRRLAERRHRPLWLYVLQSISDARPAHDTAGLNEATLAWQDWGRQRGLIP